MFGFNTYMTSFQEKFLSLCLLILSVAPSQAQTTLSIPDTLSGQVLSLQIQNGQSSIFPGISTQTMGFNGHMLGPTLILRRNQTVDLRVFNNLADTTTVHWHGLHVAPEHDGGPHTFILPGTLWNPVFTVHDWAGTYWYHPHLHYKTNEHVSKGLSGFIIVRDSLEDALALPRTYGIDDFPLLLQTKSFNSSRQITFDNPYDSVVLVNGTRQAQLTVPAQCVRLRLLNGSSERVMNIGLSQNLGFHLIGTDGGLLEQSVALNRIQLAPGERAEVVVNLQGRTGQIIQLMSYGAELPNAVYGAAQPGMGAGQVIPGYTGNPLNGSNFTLLTLSVGAPLPQGVFSVPTTLIPHEPWLEAQADTTRVFTFMPENMGPTAIQGPFMINNQHFDMQVINHRIPFNNTEIWELVNQTPIAHPFHIHDVQFYVLSVNGQVPAPYLRGRKDVVMVPAGMGRVRFITKFETHHNNHIPYMYHCHMLTHEDHGMMGQFLVVSPSVDLQEPTQQDHSQLICYPNPVSNHMTIALKGHDQSFHDLVISDVTGKNHAAFQAGDLPQKLDVGQFAPGMYWIHCRTNKGVLRVRFLKTFE
jgi:bilirubin oxidase